MTPTGSRAPAETWILDGHNLIFAVPSLAARQEKGERRAARDAVVRGARGFAARRRVRVVVVFDGDRGGGTGERGGGVEVLYGAGRGGADDRIVRRAESLAERGGRITVVTRDRALRDRLPGRARTVDPLEFWESTPSRRGKGAATGREDSAEKPAFSAPDIEEHFLARERESRARRGAPPPKRGGRSRRGD